MMPNWCANGAAVAAAAGYRSNRRRHNDSAYQRSNAATHRCSDASTCRRLARGP